ncbi:hypothetical protein GCM10009122_48930 [Fulvivirga kasyanovii]|uniref:VLRF1 domain-containing protein n=1 Tax=Fulvivirga kasyanovii TaxID=396812 RepID=A0ABW9RJU8_9BACT|nr:hypothetical protein [Fulvivirga kasyanovii]MTI24211.1 hypothetical protein [Fulvivirga kasyanovii]
MDQLISPEETYNLIRRLKASGLPWDYDPEKHRITIETDINSEENIKVRLPVNLPHIDKLDNWDDSEESIGYILILIQAGKAALGYFDDDIMLDHKVFKSYMVRKKQGKSQVKYLKSKGKSRAGSRVRLANTVHFFESINERLQEYFEDYEINRIGLSCSKTLLPYLFSSKVSCPFDKKDERLFKIPKHIHTPGYDILVDTQEWLLQGEIKYPKELQSRVDLLLR